MIKIGLTGNRYSGKDRVATLFKQIGVPVFDADLVLKFMLNYDIEVINYLIENLPEEYFDGMFLDIDKVKYDNKFGDVILLLENDIFGRYQRYSEKFPDSIYTIFHSSILYEAGWDKRMLDTVSVFSPKKDRIERCRFLTDYTILEINAFLNTEMDDIEKNRFSRYTIHNYGIEGNVILDDVSDIDESIVDTFLLNPSKNWKIFRNKRKKKTLTIRA